MNFTIGKGQYCGRLNRGNQIEISGPEGVHAVIDEIRGQLVFDGGKSIPLNPKTVKEASDYKKSLRKDLVNYYNQLLKGEEMIELIPTRDEKDYPYIITSQKLLANGHETEKYAEVLESVFYPKSLKKVGLDTGEFFEDMHDVHLRVGRAKFSDSDNVVSITLRDLVKAVFVC